MKNEITKNNEKYMTVKEVAEVLGVSTDLIKKRIRELFPDKMKNGKITYLNEIEVTAIKLRIQENSHIITYDDHNRSNLKDNIEIPSIKSTKTDLEKELVIQQALIFQQEKIQVLTKDNTELKIEIIEKNKLIDSQIKLLSVPPKTMRAELNQLARSKAVNSGLSFGSVWCKLYNEFYYRHNINLTVRSIHYDLKPLDYAEKNNLLHDLYILGKEILK